MKNIDNFYETQNPFKYVVTNKVRVKKKRKGIIVFSVLILIFLCFFFPFYELAFKTSQNSIFVLKSVDVFGVDGRKKQIVENILNDFIGKNIFSLSSEDVKEKISKCGFVEGFLLKKILPNEISVEIKVKKPIWVIKQNGKLFSIDGNGGFWESDEGGKSVIEVTQSVDISNITFQNMMKEINKSLKENEFSLIDYIEPNSYILTSKGGDKFIVFGDKFSEEWEKYDLGKDWIKRNFGRNGTYDLRWNRRIVFKPLQSGRGDLEENKNG